MPQQKQEEKEKEATPSYVKQEDFTAAMNTLNNINSQFQQFQGFVSGLAQGQGAPGGVSNQQQQAPAIEDVTDEEYQQALMDGTASVLQKRHRADLARQEAKFNTRFTELEQRGLGILDLVSNQTTQQSLTSKKWYPLLKDQVNAEIAKIPAQNRTPDLVDFIYNKIVGENEEKIYTWRQEDDKRLAQEREVGNDTPRRSSRGQASDEVTFENTFGDELSQPHATWKGGGRVWDKFDAATHVKHRYGLDSVNDAAKYARGVMAIDDCAECFSPIVNGKCHCRRSA